MTIRATTNAIGFILNAILFSLFVSSVVHSLRLLSDLASVQRQVRTSQEKSWISNSGC
jgi:hypothetical protein